MIYAIIALTNPLFIINSPLLTPMSERIIRLDPLLSKENNWSVSMQLRSSPLYFELSFPVSLLNYIQFFSL